MSPPELLLKLEVSTSVGERACLYVFILSTNIFNAKLYCSEWDKLIIFVRIQLLRADCYSLTDTDWSNTRTLWEFRLVLDAHFRQHIRVGWKAEGWATQIYFEHSLDIVTSRHMA
jgi:hypothetical protein